MTADTFRQALDTLERARAAHREMAATARRRRGLMLDTLKIQNGRAGRSRWCGGAGVRAAWLDPQTYGAGPWHQAQMAAGRSAVRRRGYTPGRVWSADLEFAPSDGAAVRRACAVRLVRDWKSSPFVRIHSKRRALVGRDLLRAFSLFLDGAYHEQGDALVWYPLGHLETSEVGSGLERALRRMARYLRRHGALEPAGDADAGEDAASLRVGDLQ